MPCPANCKCTPQTSLSVSASNWSGRQHVYVPVVFVKSAASIRKLQQPIREEHTPEGQPRQAHDLVPVQPGAGEQRLRQGARKKP
jgi:hypothetical protein